MTEYRKTIISTYKYLLTVREELLTHSINIAMNGAMKDINETFEIGDTYQFDLEQLKGTSDRNLNMMVSLAEKLENLMLSLENFNTITEDDLEEGDLDKDL